MHTFIIRSVTFELLYFVMKIIYGALSNFVTAE
jgi:hypothetical protein